MSSLATDVASYLSALVADMRPPAVDGSPMTLNPEVEGNTITATLRYASGLGATAGLRITVAEVDLPDEVTS
ncbi:hypothetical protein BBK14_33010 [Parafrankia soli]|uniref:Uncharacterized protein n=1 Tax=Parafrankia soli TaxID=2599596 RepID=A0A1S1R115_9ACTN|nr:hypothetical protein [Parafrankia soli]OHV39391.1 hypothetical protein BBK14_33010 [Parafrankia soli]